VDVGLIPRFLDRKNFSHRGNKFPSSRFPLRLAVHQGMRELKTQKVVAFHVGYADGSGTQDSRSLREGISRNQRSAGDFQRNLRGQRQGAADGNQRSARGNVQRGGEFQQFFSVLVAAADKDGDCEWQTRPLPAFCFCPASLQPNPSKVNLTHSLPHLGGQTMSRTWTPWRAKSLQNTPFSRNQRAKAAVTLPIFAIYSLFFCDTPRVPSTSGCKLFPFRDHFLAFSVDRPKAMS